MTSAHTPGTWTVLPEEPEMDYIRIRGQCLGARYKIANVMSPSYKGVNESELVETMANARLIAAAPDLLKALQRTLNWLSSYQGEAALGPSGPYEQARSAIAAATGVQP